MTVWLREVTREEYPDTELWDKLVSLMNSAFIEGHIPAALAWTMMVLILKIVGDYRGIGLVEIIWKVCKLIVNNRLQNSITVHDVLYGFIRWGGGVGIGTMRFGLMPKSRVSRFLYNTMIPLDYLMF